MTHSPRAYPPLHTSPRSARPRVRLDVCAAADCASGVCAPSLHAVLALVVPPQVHLPLEALCADVAAKRLEARVLPAVGDQVGALAEGFAAHLALVGLLT